MATIFINRYFHPDLSATSQLLSDQAFELAKSGKQITVIASQESYSGSKHTLALREFVDNVDVHRVRTTSFGRYGLIGRCVDYATFYWSAGWRLFRVVRKGDIVVAKTDPPLLSVLAYPICKLRKATLINWLQDVYPEVAERLGIGGWLGRRLAFPILRLLRNGSLRFAHTNVVLSERMSDVLRKQGVPHQKIAVIPNWADGKTLQGIPAQENALLKEWELTGSFVVSHSGNLGRAHDIETILGAMELLEKNPDQRTVIQWLFIGGGWNYAKLRHEVQKRNLRRVQFRPRQDRERLSESLSCADVHLVSLKPALEGMILPSKVYGVMAVARPLVFIGDPDGELGQMIQHANLGKVIEIDDSAELAKSLIVLSNTRAETAALGANALELFRTRFDKRHAHQRWKELLQQVEACE